MKDPFPLVGDTLAGEPTLFCLLMFSGTAPVDRLQLSCPYPLRACVASGAQWFYASTDEYFEIDVRIGYNKKIANHLEATNTAPFAKERFDIVTEKFDDEPSDKELKSFRDDIYKWLIHQEDVIFAYLSDTSGRLAQWAKRSTHQIESPIRALNDYWVKPDGDQVIMDNVSWRIAKCYLDAGRRNNSNDSEISRLASAVKSARASHWNALTTNMERSKNQTAPAR